MPCCVMSPLWHLLGAVSKINDLNHGILSEMGPYGSVWAHIKTGRSPMHRHDQLAKYHPVPWLRWPNVSWHQVFCYWGYSRWVLGFTMGSWIHARFLDSPVPGFTMSPWGVLKESLRNPYGVLKDLKESLTAQIRQLIWFIKWQNKSPWLGT